MPSAVGAVGPI